MIDPCCRCCCLCRLEEEAPTPIFREAVGWYCEAVETLTGLSLTRYILPPPSTVFPTAPFIFPFALPFTTPFCPGPNPNPDPEADPDLSTDLNDIPVGVCPCIPADMGWTGGGRAFELKLL